MEKKKLTAAILTALMTMSASVYAAERTNADSSDEMQSYELSPVDVEGQRAQEIGGGLVSKEARMGIMGDVDILDIPYSMQSMTSKAIETYGDPSQPLANVLLNNPSIRTSTSSPMYSDFSMRGINMNGNHFLLNGVPSMFSQYTMPPAHIIERMDITSGPNAAVNGVSMSNNGTNGGATPAPGTINVVTKRAGDVPVTKYTQVISGRSTAGEYLDIARRFGKNNAWGIRVNAEMLDGGLSLPGSKIRWQDVFLNIDHQGKNSTTNIFLGNWDYKVFGAQRWFTYSGNGRSLPSAPESKMSYDFPETWKWMYGQIVTLNHEHKLNDHLNVFFNAGYTWRDGDKMNSGANLNFDTNGSFTARNCSNAQDESANNSYFQLGFSGKFRTGTVQHQWAVSADRSKADYWNRGNLGSTGLYGGNLYDGITFGSGFYPLPRMLREVAQWNEVNTGISLMDTMSFGKWNVMLAATRKHEHFENLTNKRVIRNDNILPTWGLTYKPTPNTAVYYGHTESFSRGYVVTDASYANVGAVLDPVRSKQNEIGVKYANKGLLTTLALFEIDEPNRFDTFDSSNRKFFSADGKNVYRGVELTSNGKIAPKWTVTGGFLYLDATRDKTQRGAKDGWFVNGTAKWSSVLGVTYQADERLSVQGRLNWVGNAYIDSAGPNGRTEIPSYATLDLGMKYRTKLDGMPMELSFMCYNALDKNYWMGRGGSTTFGLSMPRTLMFSASVEL